MPYEDLHDLPEFKDWLIQTLEPLCDADPVVMSDYIIALLKHDAVMSEDQWKEFFSRELVDFLEEKARPFVDSLFGTLSTQSFLPRPAVAPTTAPAPIPVPVQAQVPTAIPTGPAIVSSYRPGPPTGPSAPQEPIAGPSRSQQNGRHNDGHIGADVEMGNGMGQNRPRQKCFDYHEKGYCMRGANCPFEHSDDVIIPTPEMMFPPMPAMPFMPNRGRGNGRGQNRGRGGRGGPPGPGPGPGFPNFPMQSPFMPMPFFPSPEFYGSAKPPQDRNGNTLVITDIPMGSLTVPAIREYFAQFGEVTNIALEGKSKRALVSFTSNREAYQAWNSEAAVFGSRHVKVLWHRPRPGQGEAGKKALEASSTLMANMKALESGGAEGIQGGVKPAYSGPNERLQATLNELEAVSRRNRKETLIAEQKVLLKRATEGTKEEKLAILTRLKALNKEMDELIHPKVETEKAGEGDEDMVMTEKEKLDKELARLGMETTKTGDQEELMRLSAQLSALRDKASTLGIPATSAARYSPYPRGGGRARGSGRGAFQTRPMRLDNRSRTILVSGDVTRSDSGKSGIREWYEGHGGNVEESTDGWKVGFPDRGMAEKVMAMGTKDIPNAGGVMASWYTAPVGNESANGNENGSVEVEMTDDHARRDERDEDE